MVDVHGNGHAGRAAQLNGQAVRDVGQQRTSGSPMSGVDRRWVEEIRHVVADKLAAQLGSQPVRDEKTKRELGRALIVEEVTSWVDDRLRHGSAQVSPPEEKALITAIFAELFGLGRLQPLVDDPEIENIEINGCDDVWLSYADGRLERGPAVADSDEELITDLQQLAGRYERSFSTANPRLHLALPDGSRLAAMIATVPRPQVVIRRHRVRHLSLDQLAELGTLDPMLVSFLRAAVAARKNIIVTGRQNAGKTTLVAALAHEIPPGERFATIEKEYELRLHDMPQRHPRVVAMQARDGNTETTVTGRPAGEVTLRELVVDALRMNLTRIIVGEVRGDEAIAMLQAMTTGNGGSLCTLHASSARHAIERLVTLCLIDGHGMSDVFGYRLVAQAVHFIVNLNLLDDTATGGGRHRFVDEVIEICGTGESGRPAINQIFGPGRDGRAVPHTNPACLADLRRAGFNLDLLAPPGGTWPTPLDNRSETPWS